MTTKPTVLFICKHNAGRSQLGAALLELAAPDRYTATSAGISPADELNPSIAATVDELGLDITGRIPRRVTPDLLEQADIVVLMKPGLELPAEPRGTVLEWSFPDPTSWSPDDVRPMRDAVAERIERELLQP
ncbi:MULTISPECIES: low molecular weight phosphatase family protein [unclassified Curtobacterium]|jgi:protein-tyrosine-phosphatase|uniref:arsenate-mycothiol transferase ArsC n=1 Tax=unclassified Curtobacterium TaxID=257496 RepID=UPI000F49FBA8|nr:MULTISPECIES: low molecular weight phosphatase family protein [unclassified Curtobacterium]ROS36431.1 protein-tyrosine-phosphatase [Curtobacterium sp. PhB78]ROS65123.1 protein-tyrosine-phosphatase [Curtobacterium sp. PhB172]TCL79018.1 protein-tyrosine-phosphatase [Curtobacterium sp. PhB128]TCL97510.1 protein-tyrosine-phosphatase [Curtobacterium sp. PhB138]